MDGAVQDINQLYIRLYQITNNDYNNSDNSDKSNNNVTNNTTSNTHSTI